VGSVEWMGVLDGNDDRQTGRGSFEVNVGRSNITSRDCCAVVREQHALPKLLWDDLLHIASILIVL